MIKSSPLPQKWLLIIPIGGASWYFWCIDFTRNASKKGHSITVLDLREFDLNRNKTRLLKRLLNILYRTNRMSKLVTNLSRLKNVTFLKPNEIDWSDLSAKNYYKLNSESYKNGLDAEYFEKLGERVLEESQLESKVLVRTKDAFNQVSAITQSVIQKEKIDKVIIPGGRTLIPAACLSAAQDLGTDCTILEAAPAGDFGYSEYPSNFRSQFESIQFEIDRKWKESDNSKYKIAKVYLENKLENIFAKSYEVNFDLHNSPMKKMAVVFLTSGFEFMSFGTPIDSGSYSQKHQRKMVQAFCQIAKENDFMVILRAHPPILGREELFAMEDEDWATFCIENEIMYLASNSKVNSYELMKQSSLNAIYLSSAGIDSMILGAETIILGNAEFAHLVPELCSFDDEGIRSRFHSIERNIEIERIYPYAFHMATLGHKIACAFITDEGTIFYEGKQIDAPRFKFLARLSRRP